MAAVPCKTRRGGSNTYSPDGLPNYTLILDLPQASYEFHPERDVLEASDGSSQAYNPRGSGVTTEEFKRTVAYLLDGLGLRDLSMDGYYCQLKPGEGEVLGPYWTMVYKAVAQWIEDEKRKPTRSRWIERASRPNASPTADYAISHVLREIHTTSPQVFYGLVEAAKPWATMVQENVAAGLSPAAIAAAYKVAAQADVASLAQQLERNAILAVQKAGAIQSASARESSGGAVAESDSKWVLWMLAAAALVAVVYLATRKKKRRR